MTHFDVFKTCSYTRISTPEKSRQNTLQKYITFHMIDIINQLLTRHSPFASLCRVDELTAKPSSYSILGCLSNFLRLWLLTH